MVKLKDFRTARGISQLELAELVGVSRQTISKWENEIVQPSADNLMRLSQVLQLPLEAFLKDGWEPPEQQAVEVAAIPPETPQGTDTEPAVTPAEKPPEPVGEVLPPRRRSYRLWHVLAAAIAVIGIIAGVISFNRRDVDMVPISELEQEEVNRPIIEAGTVQPLQS